MSFTVPVAIDSPTPAPTASLFFGQPRSALLITLAIVLLLALVLRIGFASLVVSQQTPESFLHIHGDTDGYVRLGDRMFDRMPYTAGRPVDRNRGLIRPPGYPAFYAGVREVYRVIGVDLSADLRSIVWPQVALSLLQVAATYGLALWTLRSIWPATMAGLIAACSPNGIACAAIAMPDSSFAACFSIAFLGFAVLLRRADLPRVATLSGGALAIAALLKPAAIYWPIVGLPVLFIARGFNRRSLSDARMLIVPLVIVVATWTWFNWKMEGVPAYSIVSARNLRYGVVPKVELVAKLGRMPNQAEYFDTASKETARDDQYLKSAKAVPAELYQKISQENREMFLAHPTATLRVLASNLANQMTGRYKLIQKQLPGKKSATTNWIRRVVDDTDTPIALILWYGAIVAAIPLWVRDRRVLWPLTACGLGLIYIALPTSSVANEGSRLILAAEPTGAVLIAASMWRIGTWIAGRIANRSNASGYSSSVSRAVG